ncbi:alkanesulfonate monooxygenase SsuD/methylene tetrahydromethanopterin reductase-like flavin-dependent oxidoreductase (luciferase family) [Actinoalloteichus hoggarensis]|uniref:Alkanesulfonate monooxygenase n=1 Tax=Actinoalloteichus hoggarensis TaxID=1470176 RepID=A0A221W1N5_9PSEU|nr:LLM class flavin-dependent oxidoreductase [Actinoalloteichus hoggarensis]ASO19690.1 Alkanesulfonate monooxygenase [Actinoalloteichus hoggarensis]MBB5919603.1 alkanesulfonate monooxygenase SsuD/methylene tetrahydromethanopterin reductase-like flavin-dependent oxidoreductase (luciferase family) [Actinoalloteichus hoggarensis]
MDIGVGLPTTVPGARGRDLTEFARRADQQGFSTLAVLDRLVYDSYDPLVALAASAAATERIRLASTILLAAYRPSVAVLAKQLASIDRISDGRLVVGLAAGGREDDFLASGVRYGGRGRRLDEMISELTRTWQGEGPFAGVGPRPAAEGPPLLFGGHSPSAMRRAAEHGIGWIAGGSSATAYPELVRQAQEEFRRHGRADKPKMVSLSYVCLGPEGRERGGAYLRDYYSYIGPKAERAASAVIVDEDRLRRTVDEFAEAGCDELLLFPCTSDPDQVDLISKAVLA